jgi:hypothetical protein
VRTTCPPGRRSFAFNGSLTADKTTRLHDLIWPVVMTTCGRHVNTNPSTLTAAAVALPNEWNLFFSAPQIYTDWGNHYLDKIKSKRRIQHLPVDVTDGVVLADVIEAVSKSTLR